MKIEAVVGANYGDEGKGLFTDFLCLASSKPLIVLSNGGSQRGHTVNSKQYGRHVFQHFGSGTFRGAPTFYASEFLLNPMHWVRERQILEEKGVKALSYRDLDCNVQLPVDIFLNRLFEKLRGDSKHGSVGSGIWETMRRCRHSFEFSHLEYLISSEVTPKKLNAWQTEYAIEKIQEFGETELNLSKESALSLAEKEVGTETSTGNADIFLSEGMASHFLEDAKLMADQCLPSKLSYLAHQHSTFVFEQGQGLLLDPAYADESQIKHTTPSHPGTLSIIPQIRRLVQDWVDVRSVNVNYITRTYLTRHGAGEFPEEDKEMSFEDKTNVPNDYQGSIRFGKLDVDKLLERIYVDDLNFSKNPIYGIYPKVKLVVTHANELQLSEKLKSHANYIFSTEFAEENL